MGHRMRFTCFPGRELEFSHPENLFRSFYLEGWSVSRRALGNARFSTLLTASGRSDVVTDLPNVEI